MGKAISGITVEAWAFENDQWVKKSQTTTNNVGAFDLPIFEAGDYKLKFIDPSSRLPEEWWPDAETIEEATTISIQPGQRVTGIDAIIGE